MYCATTQQKREAFSDFYKDATGFRPTQDLWAEVNAMSDDEFEALWDRLCDTFEE